MIKKYLIKYSIEFIVIILGITVSFWLNEFSLSSQNEKERVKVLIGLQSEINEIRNYCTQRKATWKERFKWVCRGAPLRDAKVVERYCHIRNKKSNASVG